MDADSIDAERRIKSLLAMLEDERTQGVASRQHVEQLQAKLHCMCGSEVNHSAWEGHTPVSMYDYALDEATARAERAEAQLASVLEALEPFAAYADRCVGVNWVPDACPIIADPRADVGIKPTMGDCRKARAVLSASPRRR